MRVILADVEADMATSASFENQDRACDRLNRLPEQKPVARPLGIGAQRAEHGFIGQRHPDAGFHKIAAPRVFPRVAQTAAVAFQPIH